MFEGPELNADLTKVVIIHSEDMPWEETEYEGVYQKPFEFVTQPGLGRQSCLYKFNPGASMGLSKLDERLEILVTYGKVSDGESTYGKYNFCRFPPGDEMELCSPDGCVVFFRRREGVGQGGVRSSIDTADTGNLEPWGERGSEKVPLEDPVEANVGSWIGKMYSDIHIPDHGHPSGEEILLLEGELEDHMCICRAGTWARYPVGFRHSPFSRNQGSLMLAREGDVCVS